MDTNEFFNWGSATLVASIGIASLGIIIGPPLLLGIINYQRFGTDRNRTVLNLLTSTICWVNIWQLYIIRSLEILHFTAGPLPEQVCCFKITVKNFIISTTVLLLDAKAVTRYLFIFWIRNPMSLNDTFWHTIITACIVLFSVLVAGVGAIGSECKSSVFGICNREQIEQIHSDIPLMYLEALVAGSILLHVAIMIRIWFFEHSVKIFPAGELVFYKSAFVKELKKTEMWLFAAAFFLFIIMLVVIENPGMIQVFEAEGFVHNNFTTLFAHLVAPVLLMFAFVVLFYRKQVVRTHVQDEIKHLCGQN